MIDLLHDTTSRRLGHMRKKRKVKSMKAKREASRKRREECEEDGNEDDFWIALQASKGLWNKN